MDIIIDFDSTIYPLLTAMSTLPGGERVAYEHAEEWDSLVDLCGGPQALLALFEKAMEWETAQYFPPFPGCVAALQRLTAAGARFHVATDRPSRYELVVERYLKAFQIPYESLYCVPALDKLALAKSYGASIIIDDHPQLIQAATQAGFYVFSIAYKYNQEASAHDRAFTAADWFQLEPKLLYAMRNSHRILARSNN